MKSIGGSSYFLALAIVFFGIGTRHFVLADENCPDRHRGSRLFDQSFGLGLTHDDFFNSLMSPWNFHGFHDYFRPWRRLASLTKDLGSTIQTDKDQFKVNLDVQHFSPDEILVKTGDGYVVVEAKHEEKEDEHGYVSRQFVRRYALPEGTDSQDVVSQLSSDGVLTLSAPRKPVPGKGERVVPITQTGPVRVDAKATKEEQQGTCDADKCQKK